MFQRRSTSYRIGVRRAVSAIAVTCLGLATMQAGSASADTVTTAADWASLQAAFAAGSGTVLLTGDITEQDYLTVRRGSDMILDLNGHDLNVSGVPSDNPGVLVPGGAALTITSGAPGGSLEAAGGFLSAGIGGDASYTTGSITILGGSITASGQEGAGIGTGDNPGPARSEGGTVTISGGTVAAFGASGGAGIGGGDNSNSPTVLIQGGTVDASSDGTTVAIGGGYYANPTSPGSVTITGGTVHANGGIGSGQNAGHATSVTISGASTQVNSTGSTGIGGSPRAGETETVTIDGGTVTATGTDGPGIGAQVADAGTTDVVISGGHVTATSNGNSAGIGGAVLATGGGSVVVSGVAVDSTVVSATAHNPQGAYSPAIGSSAEATLPWSVDIRTGAQVTVHGSSGVSAVGAGFRSPAGPLSNAGDLIISSGSLRLPSGSTMTNSGFISGGSIVGAGTLVNTGTILIEPNSVAGGGTGDGTNSLLVSKRNYLLSFNPDGGALTQTTLRVFAGTLADAAASLPQPTPPAGGSFAGWFTAATGGSQVNAGTFLTGFGDGPTVVPLYAHYQQGGQSITFPPLADATYGGADQALGASASSGLPVSYASLTSDVCTVVPANGSAAAAVHVVGAGRCTISASQSGSAGYLGADPAIQSFTVNPAPVTITASSGSFTYGQQPPTVTADVRGLVNGEDAFVLGTLTCGTAATATTPVRRDGYPTSCSGAQNPDYAITYLAGTVTENPAPLTITASSESVTYGTAPSAITARYSGFVNGEGPNVLTTPPTCGTSATATSPVVPEGYATTCSGSAATNYAITYTPGTVTITPAPLTVTPATVTTTYGTAPPAITPTYSGFAGDDTAAVLHTAPTCTTTVSAATPAGTYPGASSCSGGSDGNYTFTYNTGAVVVGQRMLTVTASSPAMTYGDPTPTVTASYSGFVAGEDERVLTSPPTCATTATPRSAVGSHPETTCSGAAAANYTIVYVPGSVTVAPAPLTITASSGSSTYGQDPPAITANVRGLVNGEKASVLGTITCSTSATATTPVRADGYPTGCSGAEDPNYAITYVDGSITENPAPLTITASDATFTYGSTPPVITASYRGFVNGESASALSSKPTCTTTATSSSPVVAGGYPSTCSSARAANYAISYVPGVVTVTPAPLSVLVNDATRVYGAADPVYSYSLYGLVNGDDASAVHGSITLGAGDTATTHPGKYPITVVDGALTAQNYAITYQPGTLTITKAPITVTGKNVSFLGGTFTVTVTNAATGSAAAGEPVTVTASALLGGAVSCAGTTNDAGVATCTVRTILPLSAGSTYRITVAATTDYLAGSGTGKITLL